MDWIEISVQADGEAAEAVSELFNRLNSRPDGQGGAVTEVGGFDPVGEDHHPFVTVNTYLPADEPRHPATASGRSKKGCGSWAASTRWASRRCARWPRRIGPTPGRPAITRCASAGTSSSSRPGRRPSVQPAPGDLPIILDPGMAFGTGLHPSTQLCLLAMEDVIAAGPARAGRGLRLRHPEHRRGPAGRGARWTRSTSTRSRSRATEENAALNDLPLPINVGQQPGPGQGHLWTARRSQPDLGRHPGQHPAARHHRPARSRACTPTWRPGGRMILAGIIEEREPEVARSLAEHGLTVRQRLGQGDWVSLVVGGARPHERSRTRSWSTIPHREASSSRGGREAPSRTGPLRRLLLRGGHPQAGAQKRLRRHRRRCAARWAPHPLYEMDVDGRRVAVFIRAWRAAGRRAAGRNDRARRRRFIACGGAGVLDREIAVGHVVVPVECSPR